MDLTKLSLSVQSSEDAAAVSDLLSGLEPTALAVSHFHQGGEWRVEAYYSFPPDHEELARRCHALVPTWAGSMLVEPVPDANWVAVSQAALPPVAIGPFVVHGSHDRRAAPRGRWSIEIDANEAFGTAHHASTQGCLVAIGHLARRLRFRSVLDLGCGSGILAFAAARLMPAASVLACDIDPRAIEVARINARLNHMGRRIAFAVADGVSHPRLRNAKFDLVLANMTAEPLIRLAPQLARAVLPSGWVILSGLLDKEAHKTTAAYRAAGFICTATVNRQGWMTLLLQRRQPSAMGYSQ